MVIILTFSKIMYNAIKAFDVPETESLNVKIIK